MPTIVNADEGGMKSIMIIKHLKAFDYTLALLVMVLSVFGVMMIHAVANLQIRYAALPAQQQLHVITGVIVMLIVAMIDYRFIARFFIPIYFISVTLLIAVLIIGPDEITATARWIRLTLPGGFDLSIQPSEFAKIFLIISLAGFIDNRGTINHPLWLLLYLILAGLPVVLVIMQLSLSAALVLLAIALFIMFIAGLYLRVIVPSVLLLLPVGILVYFDMLRENHLFIDRILSERQLIRVWTFLDPATANPDALLQIERSQFAIGSGGLYGLGFMNNITWVIHGHNDFVFAVAAEQFGFVGSIAILTVIGVIIVKCFWVAYRAEDMLGRLIAGGVGSLLLFQTFINVGVVTKLLPNTGMPFPFMSYGGSHMWVHMAAIGLVLNIGLSIKKSEIESEE